MIYTELWWPPGVGVALLGHVPLSSCSILQDAEVLSPSTLLNRPCVCILVDLRDYLLKAASWRPVLYFCASCRRNLWKEQQDLGKGREQVQEMIGSLAPCVGGLIGHSGWHWAHVDGRAVHLDTPCLGLSVCNVGK